MKPPARRVRCSTTLRDAVAEHLIDDPDCFPNVGDFRYVMRRPWAATSLRLSRVVCLGLIVGLPRHQLVVDARTGRALRVGARERTREG